MRSGEIIVLLVAQPVVGKPRIKLFRACGPAERVSGGTGLCVRGWEGACPWLVGWSCALVSVCVLEVKEVEDPDRPPWIRPPGHGR